MARLKVSVVFSVPDTQLGGSEYVGVVRIGIKIERR